MGHIDPIPQSSFTLVRTIFSFIYVISELLNLAWFLTARTEAEVVKYWSLDPETAWRKESLYTANTHTEAEGVKHLGLDPGTPSIYRQPELKRHEAGLFAKERHF